MKIVWLCSYSLYYLRDKLPVSIPANAFHPATWLYYMSREIASRENVELHIITFTGYVKNQYKITEDNITYHIFPIGFRFLSVFLNKVYVRAISELNIKPSFKKILKRIDEIDPDIVNAHGTEAYYGLILNKIDYPSVVWIQGVLNLVSKFDKSSIYKKRVKDENSVFIKQKYFITVKGNMEDIIYSYNPNAIFKRLYYPLSDYAFKIRNTSPVKDADIVYVGGIIKRKGIEDLIDAAKIVKEIIPDIKIKVIGISEKKYLDFLKSKINSFGLNNNIRLLGAVPNHDDVIKEVKKSRLFVLPTHIDAGPRAVAESMAAGIPVISNNIDGLPAMIENGISGILVGRQNIQELANAILDLLNNPDKRKILSKNAAEYADENFHSVSIVNNLLNIYSEIIKSFKPKRKIK